MLKLATGDVSVNALFESLKSSVLRELATFCALMNTPHVIAVRTFHLARSTYPGQRGMGGGYELVLEAIQL
jgi:hypothetical protein